MLTHEERQRFLTDPVYRAERMTKAKAQLELARQAWQAHVDVEKMKLRIALRPLWEATEINH